MCTSSRERFGDSIRSQRQCPYETPVTRLQPPLLEPKIDLTPEPMEGPASDPVALFLMFVLPILGLLGGPPLGPHK
jgi:hypothetical protein